MVFVVIDGYLLDDATTPDADEFPQQSIAVLPFTDLSPESDQEYFSDGLTEELLNRLAQIKDLQVAGRTSSLSFKDRNEDLREIGRMLGVAHLLEGSVRKSGNQLRITTQLINAADGYHLWSETYDRELADVFEIQDDIAEAVATALSITLGAGDFSLPGATRNVEAYDELLQAAALVNEAGLDSRLAEIDHLERAVTLDPDFGRAWISLAAAYRSARAAQPSERADEFNARIAEAVARAEASAPRMAELFTFRTSLLAEEGNLIEAERGLRQLIDEYGDSFGNATGDLGVVLLAAGQRAEALALLERARRLNPLSLYVSWQLAQALVTLGRTDEALVEVERGLSHGSAVPSEATMIPVLRGFKWFIALEAGDIQAAAAAAEGMTDSVIRRVTERLFAGEREAALGELRSLAADRDASTRTLDLGANLAAVLGDPELALDLRLKSGNRAGATAWFSYNRELRRLPGFNQLMRDTGLVDYWRATGEWGDFCRPLGDDEFVCE